MRQTKWDWKAHLTEEEKFVVASADAAKAEWQRLVAQRAYIQNRAIQRARYAATRAAGIRVKEVGDG